MTKSANEYQVAGNHYASAIQHWDLAVAHFGRGYLQGQVTKYVCRWRKKGGVQDLEKAHHFLRKLMEVDASAPSVVSLEEFVRTNAIPAVEAEILRCVAGGSLAAADAHISALIAAEPSRDYVDQDRP